MVPAYQGKGAGKHLLKALECYVKEYKPLDCACGVGTQAIGLAADIMVTSFRTAFAAFVSPETMDACNNPDNCRDLLESIYQEGKMHFLVGGVL